MGKNQKIHCPQCNGKYFVEAIHMVTSEETEVASFCPGCGGDLL